MIDFKKEFITPDKARELLEANTNNRKIKLNVVKRYSQDILNDLWKEDTGEAIKISVSSRILDGQHRLLAIIKADKGMNLHVIRNVSDDVFSVLDSGVVRTAADTFYVGGAKNSNIIPQTIQMSLLIKKGNQLKQKRASLLSSQELLAIYQQEPDEWQSVAEKINKWFYGFSRILPISLIGGVYVAFKDKVGENIAEDFMNQFLNGREINNDTIFWLRKRLTEDKLSKTKITQKVKLSLIIRTWNLFRQGKQVKSLRITDEIEGII